MSVQAGNRQQLGRQVRMLKRRTERLKSEIIVDRVEIAEVRAGAMENRQRIIDLEDRVDDLEGTGE